MMEYLCRCSSTHWLPISRQGKEILVQYYLHLLQQTRIHPHLVDQPEIVEELERSCVDKLVSAIGSVATNKQKLTPRKRGLQRAIALLSHPDTIDLTIPQICTAAEIGQRTLEYAFRESIGTSPINYLKTLRYHRLRRELVQSKPGYESIQSLAMRHSLFQLGRVAGEYRSLFGEAPSETLQHEPGLHAQGLRAIAC